MKRINQITREEQDIKTMRKTTDGYWVDTQDYLLAGNIAKKGALTLWEVDKYNKVWDNLVKTKRALILTMRKKADAEGKKYMQALRELMTIENQLAIKKYKKIAKCLTIMEHLVIMEEILELWSNYNSPDLWSIDMAGYDSRKLIDTYDKDRSYILSNML